jgi:hypothetical protein
MSVSRALSRGHIALAVGGEAALSQRHAGTTIAFDRRPMIELLETRRVFMAVLALGLFAMAARSVADPDVWWHLRTGQLIIQNHQAFHQDPYSFTRAGQPWINHEWLSEVAMYGVYSLAGWGGLIIGFAAIITISSLLVYLRCPGRPYVAGIFTVWGAVASAPTWGARPQMFSLLLASIFLLVLERSDKNSGLVWWTPPLTLLWVNLHGGYFVGIGLMVLFLVGKALEVAFGFEDWTQAAPHLRRLVFALAACLAVVPLNPNGMRMYWYPLETIRSSAMLSYVDEWFSPNFHQAKELPFLCMLLATFLVLGLSSRRVSVRNVLLLLATMWLALSSVRHIPIYVLIAVPILSRSIQLWLEEHGATSRFGSRANSLWSRRMLVNATILATFVVFTMARVRTVINRQPETEAEHFPATAVFFLERQRPPGPIFNDYNWGGYLIGKLYPHYRVFIDGRTDLYGDSFMGDFYATYHVTDGWKVPIQQWQIRTVVLPPDVPLVTALRFQAGWKQVYADSQAVILTQNR